MFHARSDAKWILHKPGANILTPGTLAITYVVLQDLHGFQSWYSFVGLKDQHRLRMTTYSRCRTDDPVA